MRTTFASIVNAAPNKCTVTIAGTGYSAVKAPRRKEYQVQEYGLGSDYKFSVSIPYAAFSTLPDVDDIATVGGVDYRIMGMESDAVDISLLLDLGAKY